MKVIGVTGTIGSGKDFVKEFLAKKIDCYSIGLSSVIRTAGKKLKNFDRKTLQDLGNELRKKYGTHILTKLAVEYLQKDRDFIIIDGIRNVGEAEYLRKTFGKNFKLIAVDAPQKIRFERIINRQRDVDPKSWEEFLEMEKRDLGENEPEYGQQVKRCIEMADFKIENDGDIENTKKKIEEIANQF